ncbi:MAG: bifunctional adenosylcobinamide kinase/adenosylcobinamide-phosphate guanylyltransferase [Firmicutes bacterium]|jgi:adenosylcobinamide kinase/adenosylcobinamide-phosphate guanylyltransferase|nr:bifunctional adenosylcobinamide kinase/adenosylcobinamide-phosphate guanylyltransferase [Bacillota bacterium]
MNDAAGTGGRLVLITGGARSGKSRLAEAMVSARGTNVLYVATAVARDREMEGRIAEHRRRRPSTWEVVEATTDPGAVLRSAAGRAPAPCGVIIDCLTVLVSNVLLGEMWLGEDDRAMDDARYSAMERKAGDCLDTVMRLIAAARSSGLFTVVVTNEVGSGIVPEYPAARLYRDVAGRANQVVAQAADEVWFVCSGIPVRLKPGPVVAGWTGGVQEP